MYTGLTCVAAAAPAAGCGCCPASACVCSENANVCTTLVFYAYPSKPGWTRFYGTSWVTDSKGDPIKSFSLFATAMPPWVKHVLG